MFFLVARANEIFGAFDNAQVDSDPIHVNERNDMPLKTMNRQFGFFIMVLLLRL